MLVVQIVYLEIAVVAPPLASVDYDCGPFGSAVSSLLSRLTLKDRGGA